MPILTPPSIEELIEWGRSHGLKAEWIDRRNALPHYDLFGEGVRLAGEGVTRAELVMGTLVSPQKPGDASFLS